MSGSPGEVATCRRCRSFTPVSVLCDGPAGNLAIVKRTSIYIKMLRLNRLRDSPTKHRGKNAARPRTRCYTDLPGLPDSNERRSRSTGQTLSHLVAHSPFRPQTVAVILEEGPSMTESEPSRTHEDRFRCPQCGRMVTVTAAFRRQQESGDAMVQFDCSMSGMCGSPIWDPCPMYLAYMERVGRSAGRGQQPPA